MKAYFQKRIFEFNNPAGTSRGILTHKPSWYIYLYDENAPQIKGVGEVSIIPGLSYDNEFEIESELARVCAKINAEAYNFKRPNIEFPAIRFGLEVALADYYANGSKLLYDTSFTQGETGIGTNGLIWMGNSSEMFNQIKNKIDKGFRCLKMKIGAISFTDELELLKGIRKEFSPKELELRVDANGAFTFNEAKENLKILSEFTIHSIEQPILPNQLDEMAELCSTQSLPIALDEELIGKHAVDVKRKLVEIIKPQYLILKPGLLGGLKACDEWIEIANSNNIGWWATSALESNIGLNAIAQWVSTFDIKMYQGLGLGNLYKQNVDAPLELRGEKLFYNPKRNWSYEFVY